MSLANMKFRLSPRKTVEKISVKYQRFWREMTRFMSGRSFLIPSFTIIFLMIIIFNFLTPPFDEKKIQEINNQRENISEKILFWKNLSQEVPGYRDAFAKLAILNAQLQQTAAAKNFLNQALAVDPNNLRLKQITEKLR